MIDWNDFENVRPNIIQIKWNGIKRFWQKNACMFIAINSRTKKIECLIKFNLIEFSNFAQSNHNRKQNIRSMVNSQSFYWVFWVWIALNECWWLIFVVDVSIILSYMCAWEQKWVQSLRLLRIYALLRK